jgi:plasmid stabilization system protein ParE
MVNYKVVLSPNAKASLRNISNYLTRTASPAIANKVRKGITDAIKKLAKQPQVYEKEHDICTELIVYRRMFQWDY